MRRGLPAVNDLRFTATQPQAHIELIAAARGAAGGDRARVQSRGVANAGARAEIVVADPQALTAGGAGRLGPLQRL